MFDPLRAEVIDRFNGIESFFKAAHRLKGDAAQIAKGLAFVQMYSVYEYTVCTVVQTAIDVLVSHNHSKKDLTPSLMALFLDSELTSLRDCTPKDVWDRRLKLFNQVFSDNFASVGNTVFPYDGSHFRHSHLQLIFDVLGIKRTPAQRNRHLHRIDEVVDHRNAISHGRETAQNVGRRFSRSDILHIIKQIRSVCLLLISAIQKHCADSSLHRRK
jgi:MAE_28990/MAE_18760-like HEPN